MAVTVFLLTINKPRMAIDVAAHNILDRYRRDLDNLNVFFRFLMKNVMPKYMSPQVFSHKLGESGG